MMQIRQAHQRLVAAIQMTRAAPSRAATISTAARPGRGLMWPGGSRQNSSARSDGPRFRRSDSQGAKIAEQTRLASAHRVGLAGERERPGSGATVGSEQMGLMGLLFFRRRCWFSPGSVAGTRMWRSAGDLVNTVRSCADAAKLLGSVREEAAILGEALV
jgi:hypothetical protein